MQLRHASLIAGPFRVRSRSSCPTSIHNAQRLAHCGAQENASGAIDWCRTCGNNVHADCFAEFAAERTAEGLEPLCMYCGKFWPDGEPTAGPKFPALGRVQWPESNFRPADADE